MSAVDNDASDHGDRQTSHQHVHNGDPVGDQLDATCSVRLLPEEKEEEDIEEEEEENGKEEEEEGKEKEEEEDLSEAVQAEVMN